MKKNYNSLEGKIWKGVALVLGVLAIGGLVYAASNSIVNNYYGDTSVNQTSTEQIGNISGDNQTFGASGDNNLSTYLDQDITTNGVTIDGQAWFTGTTTLKDITIGSPHRTSLTFASGTSATTTPGFFLQVRNTGAQKICGKVEVKINTQIEGAMVFDLTTSTSANSITAGGSLIASTTLATATTPLIDSAMSKGTGVGVAGQSWIWDNGTYIIGTLGSGTRNNATTTDYNTASGTFFVNCHTL